MARDRLAFIGTPSARATISSVRPALIRDAESGYPVAIGAIIQGQEVDLSVDERSCLLLLAAIPHYLNLFQSAGLVGTFRAEAANPSASSCSPLEMLPAAVDG